MYKPVIFVVVSAVSLALLVGINPPSAADLATSDNAVASTEAPAENVAVEDMSAAGNGFASTTIRRSEDGHFYADAMVNGAQIRFLVDTGATSVSLTKADAQSAGLQFMDTEFTDTGEGAGGAVALKPITLQRLGIGPVEANNVKAVIGDDTLKQSLLGQSFLSRLSAVNIEGDRMELR